jgi:hypothetical protein
MIVGVYEAGDKVGTSRIHNLGLKSYTTGPVTHQGDSLAGYSNVETFLDLSGVNVNKPPASYNQIGRSPAKSNFHQPLPLGCLPSGIFLFAVRTDTPCSPLTGDHLESVFGLAAVSKKLQNSIYVFR